jgi:hypothetical protein
MNHMICIWYDGCPSAYGTVPMHIPRSNHEFKHLWNKAYLLTIYNENNRALPFKIYWAHTTGSGVVHPRSFSTIDKSHNTPRTGNICKFSRYGPSFPRTIERFIVLPVIVVGCRAP